ncbi:sugar O-acetyltransferase [Akkermansiaceae bacterium]|nr:sugar O-acetyltransferase [Akkermansiaceae bacterium]
MRSEKEKMVAGELYLSSDLELVEGRVLAKALFKRYNHHPDQSLLRELLGTCPDEIVVEPDFKCDYGYNIHLGENFYSNFDLVILDGCEVRIGRNCLIGPSVSLYTASHPLDLEVRRSGLEFGAPISIGDDVWIGGRTVINPGVTLGNNVVVASGSVVTKSFHDNCLIGGVPAKLIKTL